MCRVVEYAKEQHSGRDPRLTHYLILFLPPFYFKAINLIPQLPQNAEEYKVKESNYMLGFHVGFGSRKKTSSAF